MLKYANCTTKVSIFVQFWGVTNVAKQLCPQLKPKKRNELIKLLNDLLHRQVQKVGPDQLGPLVRVGSTRIDSDRIKRNKNKIKVDSDQLGSTKKSNLISKTENLTHLEGKKGQIILFFSVAFSRHFLLLVPIPLKSCYELMVALHDARVLFQGHRYGCPRGR